MYSTGVTVADSGADDQAGSLTRTRRDGVLAAAPWALPPRRAPADLSDLERGRAVYRAACQRCHELEGYNAMRPLVADWSPETIRGLLDRLDEVKPAMPPFPGVESEKDDLAKYLQTLTGRDETVRTARAAKGDES